MTSVPTWILVVLIIASALFALGFIFALVDFIITIINERKYK